MVFLVYLGINVGIWLAGYLYRRYYQDVTDAPRPRLDVPRNTKGAPLPVVIGRGLIESPFVLWYGNITLNHYGEGNNDRWKVCLHYALCRTNIDIDDPLGNVPLLKSVFIDGKPVHLHGPINAGGFGDGAYQVFDPSTLSDDHPNTGFVFVTYGSSEEDNEAPVIQDSQNWIKDSYDKAGVDTTLLPPHQGMVTAMLRSGLHNHESLMGFNFTEVPVLPRIGFEVINPVGIPGLDPIYWTCGPYDGDANPICALYNLITNDEDGRLGYDDAVVDLDNFREAAVTLWEEENGFSRVYYQDSEISNVFAEICKQIDGVVVEHPVTGLITVVLARADYDPETAPLLDVTNIIKIVVHETTGWDGLATVVRVNYTSRFVRESTNNPEAPNEFIYVLRYASDSIEWRNQATASVLNVEPVTIDLPGVTEPRLAGKLLARHVRTLTVPLARATIQVDRSVFFAYPNQVYRVVHPDLGAGTFLMRVASTDIGEFESNAITLQLYQDRFHTSYAAPLPPPDQVGPGDQFPDALTEGKVEEAPYFWQNLSVMRGGLNDAHSQRLWYHAHNPGTNTGFRGVVQQGSSYLLDTRRLGHAGSFVLDGAYARVHEPYDTGTGFVVDVTGWVPESTTEALVRSRGANVWLVDDELLAPLTITPLGGTLYQCDDVMRGLGGTRPADHDDGARGYVVLTPFMQLSTPWANLGDAGMSLAREVTAGELAVRGSTTAHLPAPETLEDLIVRGRTLLPGTPSNLRVALPPWLLTSSTTPTNSEIDVLTEGVTFSALERARDNVELVRGDDADETPPETTVYDTVVINDGVTLVVNSGAASPSATLLSLSSGGYGLVEIGVRSRYTLALGSGAVDMLSWQVPAIPANLYEFRNLLRNGRWIDDLDHWTLTAGTPIFGTGPTQTSQAVAATVAQIAGRQDVSVVNWRALGMSAVLDFLTVRGGDASDTVRVDLTARDTGSDLATATYGPSVPSTTYSRQSVRLDNLDYETATLRVDWSQDAVGDGDLPTTDAVVNDFTLRMGQISADLGSNMDFESGLTDWTVDVGGYTDETSGAKIGTDRLQGGANAVNTIYQDVSVPAGYLHSYFVVDASCMHPDSAINSSATLTVEARTSGGTVLDTGSVTHTPTQEDLWVPLLAFCRVPTGATVLRIKLTGTRLSGSNNRLSWDDCVARCHKFLTPAVSQRYLFAPTEQGMPRTQDAWRTYHPTTPIPSVMYRPLDPTVSLEIYGGAKYGNIHGLRQGTNLTVPAWEFRREDVSGMRSRDTNVGKFSANRSFTVRVILNVFDDNSEDGVICERMVDDIGWSIYIDGGVVNASLYGTSSICTASLGTLLTPNTRELMVVYDEAADSLTLYSPGQSNTLSTAGMGQIYTSSDFDGGFLFVGRDADGFRNPTMLVAAIDIWDVALSTDQRAEVWTHGTDEAVPTFGGGVLDAESCVATVVGSNADGVIVGYSGVGQVPHDNGGIALGRDRVNLMHPFPEYVPGNGANYDPADVTPLTVPGPDGQHIAVEIEGANSENAQVLIPTMGGSGKVNVTFFARADVAGTYGVDLLNEDDGGTLVDAGTFAATTLWARVDVTFTWDASTTSGYLGIRGSNTGTPGAVQVSGPFFVDKDPDFGPPPVIPIMGSSECRLSRDGMALPAQLNQEGEILVRFTTRSDDQNAGTMVMVGNPGSFYNARGVGFLSGNVVHRHYDATIPSEVVSEVSPSSLASLTARARWNRAKLLDGTNVYAGIVVDGTGSDYDRTSIFTANDTECDSVYLGSDVNENDPCEAVLHELWIRSREPLLE